MADSTRHPGACNAPAAGDGPASLGEAALGARRVEPQVPEPESFENALGELEALVHRMESGTMSLEDSLAAYRRGASLVSWCRKSLSDVQQQVRVLEADLLRPLDAASREPDTGPASE